MTAARRLDRMCLIVAMLSIVLFSVAAGQPALLVMGLVGVLGARLLTGPFPGGRPWSTGVISLLVTGVVGFFGMRAWVASLDVELFSQFVVALMVVKTLDRRRVRDVAQLLSLGVFLCVGALLTSSTLWVGLLSVALIPLIVTTTMLYQMAQVEPKDEHAATAPQVARARRDLRVLGGVVSVLGLLIAGVVFVLLPRGLGERAFGQVGAAGIGRVVGFTNEVRLGTGGLISDSPTPVLDLEVRDRAGNQLGSAGRAWYLRGAVLDVYNEGSWQNSRSDLAAKRVRLRTNARWVVSSSSSRPRQEWTVSQRIVLRNTNKVRTPLFCSWEPLQVKLNQPSTLLIGSRGGSLHIEQHQGMLSYTVQSRVVLTGEEFAIPPDKARTTGVSFADERVRAFTYEALNRVEVEPDPALRPLRHDQNAARAIEQHLRSQFAYTLSPERVPNGRDPIWWFLDEAQRGHCEYFASAMTAMCRSVGIPARVVTGYVATDFNEITGQYVVRQSNAHAWVEVQVVPPRLDRASGLVRSPGVWRVYDPTPPGEFRAIHQPLPTWRTKLTHLIESAEHAWITNVVSYDAHTQESLLGRWSGGSVLSMVDSRVKRAVRDGGGGAFARTTLYTFGGLLIAAMGWWLVVELLGPRVARAVRRLWVRLDPLGQLRRHPNRQVAILHQRLLDLLDRAGHAKPAWRPLLDHVRTKPVAVALPESIETAAQGLNRARFAGQAVGLADVKRILRAIVEAEQAMHF